MSDWDKPDNVTSTIGYLTLYHLGYSDELSDYVHKFDWEHMSREIDVLKSYFDGMIDSYGDDEITEEYDLVGLNSNSFKIEQGRSTGRHNLFLEWDRDAYIPDMHILEQFGGMIMETGGGIHVLREDNLSIQDLISTMKRWNCCKGYTDYSSRRAHACLRVSPKQGGNRLKILKNQEGFLYSVYKELVESLDKEI